MASLKLWMIFAAV